MSKIVFRWQDFSVKFLNAVLQSSKTPAKYHPPVEYDEAAFVAPYLGNLCKFPDEHFVSKYREEIEEYFWFYVKFWGIQDFNIIDLDNI